MRMRAHTDTSNLSYLATLWLLSQVRGSGHVSDRLQRRPPAGGGEDRGRSGGGTGAAAGVSGADPAAAECDAQVAATGLPHRPTWNR